MSLLRRALAHHRSSLSSLLRASLQCRSLSHISSSNHLHASPLTPFYRNLLHHPSSDFIKQIRRSFAKGRKSRDDDNASTAQVEDIGPIVKSTAVSQMEAAIEALSRELVKLRTGRASPGMLDHIIVETSGVKMALNHLALVTVIDPKTLSINPYDPDTIKELEKAIVSSPLGLNPKADGQRLIAVIPPLTQEHIKAMCKIVAKSSEDVKQSIRRARQKALDTIKKAGYPKDSAKRLEKEARSPVTSNGTGKESSANYSLPIGQKISRREKINFLVKALTDAEDSKDVIYGMLDAWVAWEQNFPIAPLKNVLLALEREHQWHRVVQVQILAPF